MCLQLLTLMFIMDLADSSEAGYVSLLTSAVCCIAFVLLIAYQWRNRIVATNKAVDAWVKMQANWSKLSKQVNLKEVRRNSPLLADCVGFGAREESPLTMHTQGSCVLAQEHCAVVIQANWRGFVARKQLHAHKEKHAYRHAVKVATAMGSDVSKRSLDSGRSPSSDDAAQSKVSFRPPGLLRKWLRC